jgi:cob(I)alamin adenosyltransferase
VKTFNKKGDSGETSLLYGERVPKSHLRCEAYGTIDEAVSALGLARQFCKPQVNDIILSLQQELFIVGSELATPAEHYTKLSQKKKVVTPDMVNRLEVLIDEVEAQVKMPEAFIIPGECGVGAATLDVARTVVRRAERRINSLRESGVDVNDQILRYINRLADLIFTLARYQEIMEKD